jgi:hypothetical protein
MDPDNAEVGTNDPWVAAIEPPTYQSVIKGEEPLFIDGGNPFDYSSGFQLNGMSVSRGQLEHMMDTGAAGGGLSIGGRDGGFLDFTGHGAMGLSFVNGEFGSIRIGIGNWVEDAGSMLPDAVSEDFIWRTNTNNDGLGHWQYTYRDVSFGGQYQAQANHAGPSPQKSTNEFTPEQFEQFKSCLSSMFKVYYKGHRFENGGEAYFEGHSDVWPHFWSGSVGDFTIRTDQQSYTTAQLKVKRYGLLGDIGGDKVINGLTEKSSPYVNAIANNAVLKGSEPLGIWVHELGNSLSFITNIVPPASDERIQRYDGDKDAGTAFEDCVFGGHVTDTGIDRPK